MISISVDTQKVPLILDAISAEWGLKRIVTWPPTGGNCSWISPNSTSGLMKSSWPVSSKIARQPGK